MAYETPLTKEALDTAIARVTEIAAAVKDGDYDKLVSALNDIRDAVEVGFNDYRQAVAMEQRAELTRLRAEAAKADGGR
jgi:hypothetical protein